MRTAFLGFVVAPLAVYYVASTFHVSTLQSYISVSTVVQYLHSYTGTGLVNWRANPWQQNLPTQNGRKNRSSRTSLFQICYDVHTFLHNSIATLQPVTITLLNRACAGARCESFSIAMSRWSSSSSLSSHIRSFKTRRLGCCEEKELSSFSWLSKSLVSEQTWIR